MPNLAFTTQPDITIPGVDGHYDVYVKSSSAGLELFKDDGPNREAYPQDPSFPIPCMEKFAIYFRFTADSDAGVTFPTSPLQWPNNQQPSTIQYWYMNADQTAFSIEDANDPEHTEDVEHSFTLFVDPGEEAFGISFVSGRLLQAIDPTIIEKGEEGGSGGYEEVLDP